MEVGEEGGETFMDWNILSGHDRCWVTDEPSFSATGLAGDQKPKSDLPGFSSFASHSYGGTPLVPSSFVKYETLSARFFTPARFITTWWQIVQKGSLAARYVTSPARL